MTIPQLLLILDTETTGLDGEVIELGIILYHVEAGMLGQLSYCLPFDENPAEHINRIPAAIGKIAGVMSHTHTALAEEWMGEADAIVAHNAPFDKARILDTPALTLLHDHVAKKPWLDTCHDFTWPRQSRKGGKLVEIALEHGIGVMSAHRALVDCQLISALFDRTRLARRGGSPLLPQLIANAALPRIEYKALVSYARKNEARDAGFKWNGDRKAWLKRLTEQEAAGLSFDVEVA